MQSDVTQEMTIIDNDIVTKIIIIKQQSRNEMLEKTQGFYQILTHLSYIQVNYPWGKNAIILSTEKEMMFLLSL